MTVLNEGRLRKWKYLQFSMDLRGRILLWQGQNMKILHVSSSIRSNTVTGIMLFHSKQFHSNFLHFTCSYPRLPLWPQKPSSPQVQNISSSPHPSHPLTGLSTSRSPCSPSILLRGIHRIGILQWHRVPDRLWRPLSKMDWVSGLCDAVPWPRFGWPRILQEPRPRVQPLVFL